MGKFGVLARGVKYGPDGELDRLHPGKESLAVGRRERVEYQI
jgi:hypothetical protein